MRGTTRDAARMADFHVTFNSGTRLAFKACSEGNRRRWHVAAERNTDTAPPPPPNPPAPPARPAVGKVNVSQRPNDAPGNWMTSHMHDWVELIKVCVHAVAAVGVTNDSLRFSWKHS